LQYALSCVFNPVENRPQDVMPEAIAQAKNARIKACTLR